MQIELHVHVRSQPGKALQTMVHLLNESQDPAQVCEQPSSHVAPWVQSRPQQSVGMVHMIVH